MADKTTRSFAAHSKDAKWEKEGLRPYFKYRDLGIKEATEGRVLAHIIRADQPCAGALGYHSHDLEFQMVHLIKGWARLSSMAPKRSLVSTASGSKASDWRKCTSAWAGSARRSS